MKRCGAREILQTLAGEIEGGKYPIGTTLPTRNALAQRFGVARATVDHAARDLANRGMIQSRRGAGSVVVNMARMYQLAFVGSSMTTTPPETRSDVICTPLAAQTLATRAAREKLLNFDGIVWSMPGDDELKWAKALQGRVPQIVTNRTPNALNYVSTDHAGAVFALTHERLEEHPDWLPVFLGVDKGVASSPVHLRRNGFVQACREQNVFYEDINLPQDYQEKLSVLHERFNAKPSRGLLIVSGSMSHSGAVIAWARETGRVWHEHLLYSDFDNDLEANVLGVAVTSFLQDYARLRDLAITGLTDIIRGNKDCIQILQPPLRRDGTT